MYSLHSDSSTFFNLAFEKKRGCKLVNHGIPYKKFKKIKVTKKKKEREIRDNRMKGKENIDAQEMLYNGPQKKSFEVFSFK